MTIAVERLDLNYRLTFESAFHFGTGLRRGLIQRTVVRDRQDYLYVPGSTLKGVVRERCEQLADLFGLTVAEPHNTDAVRDRAGEANINDPDIIYRIFGSRYLPGQLYFDNALLASGDSPASDKAGGGDHKADGLDHKAGGLDRTYFDGRTEDGQTEPGKYKARQVEYRTQVSLSRLTRTAQPGRLYTGEYGVKQLCFEGKIYGYLQGFVLEEVARGTYSLLLLLAGLLSVERMGGKKSTGAGKVRIEIMPPGLRIDGQAVDSQTILAQLPYLEYYQLEREENA